ncbi:hypothetical protein [Rhodococcoides kyotonense]|uniref:Uncharacterized protein n=1 Tax=Rhodococcoides kyotonense TaxID=398843 RepID=A0A239LNV1_9NOCA|nr:hypothetical protein [Rhodococcus kyotonensis]SNT31304.1 hypothetical protein SAMN05421642_113147 [Rhodococcus kyotonensis]
MRTPIRSNNHHLAPTADMGQAFDPHAAIESTLTRFFHDIRHVGGTHPAAFPVSAERIPDAQHVDTRVVDRHDADAQTPQRDHVQTHDNVVAGATHLGDIRSSAQRDTSKQDNESHDQHMQAQSGSVDQHFTSSFGGSAALRNNESHGADRVGITLQNSTPQATATAAPTPTAASATLAATPVPTSPTNSVASVPLSTSVQYTASEATAATYTAPTADLGTASTWSAGQQTAVTTVADTTTEAAATTTTAAGNDAP